MRYKRGFSSLFGVTSLVKSSYSKACEPWKDKKKTPMNIKNGMKHTLKKTCSACHEGSAGKMEVDGVIEMFRRFLENLLTNVGDGDSKTYTGIAKAAFYG